MDAIEEINENISLTDSRDGRSFCFVFKQQNRKQVEEETEKRERVNAQTIQRTQTQREREGQNGGNTKLNQQQVC